MIGTVLDEDSDGDVAGILEAQCQREAVLEREKAGEADMMRAYIQTSVS